MTRPHNTEWRREMLHWLTKRANVLRYPVGVFGRWKGKAPKQTMEDFVNWELGQSQQQPTQGHHPTQTITLEDPIHTPHKKQLWSWS